MFSFISDYFKNKRDKQPPQETTSPAPSQSKSIQYDPNLINELERDHADLVTLFGRIWQEGFEQKDYLKTASLIREFKSQFQAHLLTENVKFYVYLEQSLSNDPYNLKIVKEFRYDMNNIATAAVKFCKKYQGHFNADRIVEFEGDYGAVGEVLTRRVSLEEKSLYVLYQAR
ncbi:hypothetical protein EDC56_1010 [Sinobacterium caligoides]|uniref:Hemerythrin-like domain-containing protein n=1 Tax=Sinobacterium caligoides TaxID=933926 RepID=A0A3N2E060_9GAMM|nr:hemerythrin domain-containing protein [Sinobacterium caligoides]ROS05480.1 hypothetical protein EDC56_1010 [Sinobacterium caligoides]